VWPAFDGKEKWITANLEYAGGLTHNAGGRETPVPKTQQELHHQHRVTMRTANLKKLNEEGVQPRFVRPEEGQTKEEAMAEHIAKIPAGQKAFLVWDPEKDGPAGEEVVKGVALNNPFEYDKYVVPVGDDVQLTEVVDGVIASPGAKAERMGWWGSKEAENLSAAASAAAYGYNEPIEGMSGVETVQKILDDAGYGGMFNIDPALSSPNGIVLVGASEPTENLALAAARGTRNFNDVMADLQLMAGRGQMDMMPGRLSTALEASRLAGDRQGEIEEMVGAMKDQYPNHFHGTTGHSLGGWLAREAGRKWDIPSITFNPAVGPFDMVENWFTSGGDKDMHRIVRTPNDLVSALGTLGGGTVDTVADTAGGFLGHDLGNFGRSPGDLQLIREGVNPTYVDEYGAGKIEGDSTLRRLRRAPMDEPVGGRPVSDWYNMARRDLYSNGPRDSVQMTSVCEALLGLRDSEGIEDERLKLALDRLVAGQCGKRLMHAKPGMVTSHKAHNHAIHAMMGNRPGGRDVPSELMALFPPRWESDDACSLHDQAWHTCAVLDAVLDAALDKLRNHVDVENKTQSSLNAQRKADNIRIATEAKRVSDEKKAAGKAEFLANQERSKAKTVAFFISHPVSNSSIAVSFTRGTDIAGVRNWLADRVGCELEQLFIGGTKGKGFDDGMTLAQLGVVKDQTLASWVKARGGMQDDGMQELAGVVEEVERSDGAGSSTDRPGDTIEERVSGKTHDSVNRVTDNALNGTPPGFANVTRGVDKGEAFIRGLPFVMEVVNGSTKMVAHWGVETHSRMDQLEMSQPSGSINDARDNCVAQWTIRMIENRIKLAISNPEFVSVSREAVITGLVAPGATPSRLTQHSMNGTAVAMGMSAHPAEFDGWGLDRTALIYNSLVEAVLYNPYSMQGFTRTHGVFFQFGTKMGPAANSWWNDAIDLQAIVNNDGQDATVREHARVWMYPRSPYQRAEYMPTIECSAPVTSFAAAPGAGPVPTQPFRTGHRQCATYDVTQMPSNTIMLGACTINQATAVMAGQLAEVEGWETWRWNNSDGVGSSDLTATSGHSVAIVPIKVEDYTSEGLIDKIALYSATNLLDMGQIGTWVDCRGQMLEDINGKTLQDEHSRLGRLQIQGTRHSGQYRTLCRVLLVLVDDMGSSGSNITGRASAMGSGREVKISQIRTAPAAANNERYHPAQSFTLGTGVSAAIPNSTTGNSINIFCPDYQAINGFQRGPVAAGVNTNNGPINIGPALMYRWATPTFWTNGICTPSGGGVAQTICEYENFQTLTAARFRLQMDYLRRCGAPQHCWESAMTCVKMNASVVRPQASIQGPDARWAWFFNPNATAAGLAGPNGSSTSSAQNWYMPLTGYDPNFPTPVAPYRTGFYDSETTSTATTLEAIQVRPGQMLPQLWMASAYDVDNDCTPLVLGANANAQALPQEYCNNVGTGATESVDQWMYQVDPISSLFQAAGWVKAGNTINPEVVEMPVNQIRCRVMHGATGLHLATQVAANCTGVGQWAIFKPPVYSQFIETSRIRKQIMHAFLRNAIARTLGGMPGWGFELGTGLDYYRTNVSALNGTVTNHFDAYLRPEGWEQGDTSAYSPLPPGTFSYFGIDPNTFMPGISASQESTSDVFTLSAFAHSAMANQVNPWNGAIESMTSLPDYSSGVGPYGSEAECKAWANLAATLFMTSGAGSFTNPPEQGHFFVPGGAAVPPSKDGMWWRLVTGTSTLTAKPQVDFMPVTFWAPNAPMWRQLCRANQDYRGATMNNPQFLMQISPSIPDFTNINNGEPRKMIINGDYNVYFAGKTRREVYIIYRQPSSGEYPLTFLNASSTSVTTSNILSLF